MKNLQIGDNDLVGKRFNGHDLHVYLRRRGIDSSHIVWDKLSDDNHTFVIAGNDPYRNHNNQILGGLEKKYGLHSILYPYAYSLLNYKQFLDADIVHYHLIHNYFFDITLLPLLTKLKPTVWTMHDPWALTGHCVHPFQCPRWKTGCGDCGNLKTPFAISKDTSALSWEMKKDIYGQMEADIVVASRWMQNLVEQSPLTSKFKVHRIPFGTKLDWYCPGNSERAKKALGIPKKNIVLSFRDQKAFKGSDYVRDALNKLKADVPITLLTTGGDPNQLDDFKGRFQVVDLGWINNDDLMIGMYQASDIFLMPSTAEAFGMMAMEAMACGKPVIVFDGTALPETVFAPEGGIAVPQGDVDALAHELEELISNREKRLKLGEQARRLAVQHYNVEDYVTKIIDLYKEVIEKRIISDRSKYIISQLEKNAEQPYSGKTKTFSGDSETSTGSTKVEVQTISVPSDPLAELAQIKSSIYFKVYDRLRRRRHLRYVSNTVIKPTIRFSWKVFKKARGFVRQYLF